ncbi:Stathmin-3 [Eufriesea mexicana]|uniref:Stathmin-3 n=1 Tax=Eufriesea mexicana TaxID=516756 RepID=A0A310SIT1_9HYME|nr:Stathmin-3 [Eufriesea mexicana]
MLIGLVRDSVRQCFCHSCKAPLGIVAGDRRGNAPFKKPSGKGKPRTKQPKKVKFITTEIRCQEKSKGGLCYEVILAEPTVPKRAPSPPQTSPTQQIAIEDKLRAAEKRRLSLEAQKLAVLAAELSKIEEASRKKDELSAAFIAATRESLDAKMNNTEEKREAHIAELRNKLKEHFESVEKTRLSLEQQTREVRCAVEEKLKSAAAQRDENIKRMLIRLKEHEEQVARVRQGMTERVQQLESQIQGKLVQAHERRQNIEREQKEKLRNHNTVKIAKVRQMADECATRELLVKKFEIHKRVSTAEQNRQREIQRRVQAIRQHRSQPVPLKNRFVVSMFKAWDNPSSRSEPRIIVVINGAMSPREIFRLLGWSTFAQLVPLLATMTGTGSAPLESRCTVSLIAIVVRPIGLSWSTWGATLSTRAPRRVDKRGRLKLGDADATMTNSGDDPFVEFDYSVSCQRPQRVVQIRPIGAWSIVIPAIARRPYVDGDRAFDG